MSLTNFPNGISSFGAPVNTGMPEGLTKVFYVDYILGSDGNKGTSVSKPFQTIQKALDSVTTNKNEGIALMGNASHVVTAMLDFSKSRVHMFGYDPGGRMYGQNAKVSMGVTTAATDIGCIKNTGIRNSFRNIKFTSANTVAQGIYTFVEGGEYTVIEGCEIYKETDLDQTGAAELVMNGDSAQVSNCYIGSTANLISGAITRANVLLTKGLAGTGLVARDVSFDNCKFVKKAGHVNNRYFYGANATDVERMLHIKNSLFFAGKLSTAVPAQCVAFAAEQTEGYCLIDNCSSIGNTKLSTTTGVYITGAVPTYATSGIAVAS